VDAPNAEQSFDALNKYARDITEAARNGKLDPVIGRDEEIRRAIQVLARRTKNNPVLIGEPASARPPSSRAGAAHRQGRRARGAEGQARDVARPRRHGRRRQVSRRVRGAPEGHAQGGGGSRRQVILFIDELHTLIGAGKADGAMDASNLLKPALGPRRAALHRATTLDEYRKHIEKDAALARRFQPVLVGEPSVADTVSILRGIREKYELHHGSAHRRQRARRGRAR
jgi:ATP-dependent Clp protease ATP-binding subunit ClpB